jgi:putative membrane protein
MSATCRPRAIFLGEKLKSPGKTKLTIYALGLAGAALFTFLLIRQGVMAVGTALATARWGIVAVAAYHFASLFFDAAAWWVLFPKAIRSPLHSLFWMRWIGESISNLVPSAAVGGDIVRARLATIKGVPVPTAAATIIVDITLGVFTQIGFTLFGLALLVHVTGRTNFVGPTLLGTLIGAAAIAGFYFVQRLGIFRLAGAMMARLVGSPDWQSLVHSGEALDRAVWEIYSRRRGVLACCGWTVISLVGSSGEIWIALRALGVPTTIMNALILHSAAMTIRSSFFLVPGALGVQEGGYLLVGNLLGIPGEAAFALSLVMRMSDLIVGIPGLVAWQIVEGRRLLRRSLGASR